MSSEATAIETSAVVFTGRVIMVRLVEEGGEEFVETTFKVLTKQKGNPGNRVAVRTGLFGPGCGYRHFTVSHEYRIGAIRAPKGWLFTNSCMIYALNPQLRT